jgi:cytochrome c
MDSFEFNKIAGGILAALLVVVGLRIVGEGVYHVAPLEKSAYSVPGVEAEAPAAGAEQAAKPAGPSFEEALANADVAKGETISHKCKTCHTIVKDGPNKIGPDLWDVVGRPVATHGGFNYSDSLKKIGGDWTFEKIEHFITKPRDFAPGTKMTFPGLPSVQDRADVIAYLNTQSDKPLPLPKPEAKPAAAPANGGAAAPAAGKEAAPAAKPDNGAAAGNGAKSEPEAAPEAPEGAGHDQTKPEEQQETHPAH